MPELTKAQVDAEVLKAAAAQEYQLPDNTRVRRASVSELMQARRELRDEEAAAEGSGMGVQIRLRRLDR
jgi:hypothetical protein